MEVRIRLQKAGKGSNKRYNYRVVAISKALNRDGRCLEFLGHYDPSRNPAVVSLDKVKIEKWIKQLNLEATYMKVKMNR